MSEQCQGSVRCNVEDLQEALSIHTRKITDSCRDKDCIEDLRVYLTKGSQSILDRCAGAKVRCAELLYTYIDVEPVAFDRNHYCIDATFYYRILADGVVGTNRPVTLYGLAVFTKRAVLCGEESCAHIFTSNTNLQGPDGFTVPSANLPTAVVEVTVINLPGGEPVGREAHSDYAKLFFAPEKRCGNMEIEVYICYPGKLTAILCDLDISVGICLVASKQKLSLLL